MKCMGTHRWSHIRCMDVQVVSHEVYRCTGGFTRVVQIYRWSHMRRRDVQVVSHEVYRCTGGFTRVVEMYRWSHMRRKDVQVVSGVQVVSHRYTGGLT